MAREEKRMEIRSLSSPTSDGQTPDLALAALTFEPPAASKTSADVRLPAERRLMKARWS